MVLPADHDFQDGDVLICSPHLDDAWLSSAALLQRCQCEVWTVFAGIPDPPLVTDWDRVCGFEDSTHTMHTRLAEDDAAFTDTGHSTRHLQLLDGAYADPARRRADRAIFARELQAWAAAHPHGTVVLPIGAGVHMRGALWERLRDRLRPRDAAVDGMDASPSDIAPVPSAADPVPASLATAAARTQAAQLVRDAMHADYQRRRRAAQRKGMAANPDHLDVRDTAMQVLTSAPTTRIVFFEELPYLWHEKGDAQAAHLAKQHRLTLAAQVHGLDRSHKLDRLRYYASQLDPLDPVERRLSIGNLPATERFWYVTGRGRR